MAVLPTMPSGSVETTAIQLSVETAMEFPIRASIESPKHLMFGDLQMSRPGKVAEATDSSVTQILDP